MKGEVNVNTKECYQIDDVENNNSSIKKIYERDKDMIEVQQKYSR